MSRLYDLAREAVYGDLENMWLDQLPGSLDPGEAAQVLKTLLSAGEEGMATSLLDLAMEAMESSKSPGMAALLEAAAPLFGRNETLRIHLVEMLRDRHLMFNPLEGFLSDSGLSEPDCRVSESWKVMKRLLEFAEERWVLHPVHGPGRITRVTRTSATVDFQHARSFELPLANLVKVAEPIREDSVAVLRRTNPNVFARLLADPSSLLERMLEEGGGHISRQALEPVLGRQTGEIWKALRDAAKSVSGIMDGPDSIERLKGGGLAEALKAALRSKQPLAARVERISALLKAAPREEQTEAAREVLADMPELKSFEAGARFELQWTLLQASGVENDPTLRGMVDPLPIRALQALSEISTPKCRRDYLGFWTGCVDGPALEELIVQLPAGQRSMVLGAASATHPDWAGEYLRRLVFAGTDSDLLLWAASVLLDGGLESEEETVAVIRTTLETIPRGRAESQRRASKMIIDRAGEALRSYLTGLDARRLSNLSDILGECGPAHETGLCLEIRRESSGRTADSGRSYFFWESDFLFDSAPAIRRRAEAIERLRTVEIPAAAATVGEAASHGDLSENAEYKAALERRDLLLERMARWSDEFARLRPYPMSDLAGSLSSPGTRIRLSGEGGEIGFELVGPLEARPEDGRVNYLAPLGAALLGRTVGDTLELPGRQGEFRVDEISILPEEGSEAGSR